MVLRIVLIGCCTCSCCCCCCCADDEPPSTAAPRVAATATEANTAVAGAGALGSAPLPAGFEASTASLFELLAAAAAAAAAAAGKLCASCNNPSRLAKYLNHFEGEQTSAQARFLDPEQLLVRFIPAKRAMEKMTVEKKIGNDVGSTFTEPQ